MTQQFSDSTDNGFLCRIVLYRSNSIILLLIHYENTLISFIVIPSIIY